jgi:hypothetical protein
MVLELSRRTMAEGAYFIIEHEPEDGLRLEHRFTLLRIGRQQCINWGVSGMDF